MITHEKPLVERAHNGGKCQAHVAYWEGYKWALDRQVRPEMAPVLARALLHFGA